MKTTKVKTIKELFVKDLARVRGGEGTAPTTTSSSTETQTCSAPAPTTQACCEEKNDNCCY